MDLKSAPSDSSIHLPSIHIHAVGDALPVASPSDADRVMLDDTAFVRFLRRRRWDSHQQVIWLKAALLDLTHYNPPTL
jgi:hypothetical protein